MIRKTRLVKVTFGSCAAIFLILQLLESSLPLTNHNNKNSKEFPPEINPTTLASSTLPPTPNPPVTPRVSANPAVKENTHNNSKESEENTLKEPKSSLSGERIHGLPNETINNNNSANFSKSHVPDLKLSRILDKIKILNEEQSIRNEDIFGPVHNDTVIVAVQVHNRLQYLRQLIISLSQATGIDKTLIIFSHDFWDEDVNDLVNSVDFAKTMQIFYPFSIQTHPNEFPGESPHDCPRNAKKDQYVYIFILFCMKFRGCSIW